jgi:hypothetical protein
MWLRLVRALPALALLVWGGMLVWAQAPEPDRVAPAPDKPQYFSGSVTDYDPKHITVSRTLVGKSPETRTFQITATTKVSRSLRVKTRVTVRYQHLPEGDVALEVQVRSLWRSPRSL